MNNNSSNYGQQQNQWKLPKQTVLRVSQLPPPPVEQPSQISVYLSLFLSLLIVLFIFVMAWSLYSNYMFPVYKKLLSKRANNDIRALNLWESLTLLYKLRLTTFG